jgi:hypothetical protein
MAHTVVVSLQPWLTASLGLSGPDSERQELPRGR